MISTSSISSLLQRLGPLAMLYAGRLGTALVGILMLPLFQKILGEVSFGMVAIILSLQTLFIMLDLGLSTSIARDIASLPKSQTHSAQLFWKQTEKIVILAYVALGIVALIATQIGLIHLSAPFMASIIILFGAVTHQNISQVTLIARQDYIWAGANQFLGILIRHLFSLVILYQYQASVDAFIYTQTVGAISHALVTRSRLLIHIFNATTATTEYTPIQQTRKGLSPPLLILSVSGACALHLDKTILGHSAGLETTAAYYLASTLAMTPITFLAAPVAQYFQPKLLAALSVDRSVNNTAAYQTAYKMLIGIVITALTPGLVIYLFTKNITYFWLHGAANSGLVSQYAQTLVIGAAWGAIGFLPHIILLAYKQYRFLAATSVVLTLLLLGSMAWFASYQRIDWVCQAVALYHIASAIILWLRVYTLNQETKALLKSATPWVSVSMLMGTIFIFYHS